MKVLVITGGIGSGKSMACRYLHSQYGWPVYEADTRVKELYASHPTLLSDIEAALGTDLRDADGVFNPKILAGIIFHDDAALSKVESFVFPVLLDDFDIWKKTQDDCSFVILESATILEKPQLDGIRDYILLIDAPVDVRLSRASSRDGVSEDRVLQRMASQAMMNDISSGKIKAPADYVIVNDGSVELLKENLDKLVQDTL